ncbi:hypothetical protein ABFS82_08G087700 [Erythranthe guttata]|uniref:Peptidase A1 domain-containing protein n=1 Tax=Erythranthe guttata TaxID=4155 RepID=A0A022PXR8_ERYGU|nr:PREDICTED: basic 7S globulin-like [Erythranthe guttata]EYU20616.1 hypothetical protein MIMGU_mgv1a026206mg [Erythranthe guttata]|eukprot:XP_012857531.1 PREDICTED: basic 7S globulin-like [Erythranthe guttata]
MAHSTISIFFFFSLCFFSFYLNAQTTPSKQLQAFIFPIKKDGKTNQYYTNIQFGSNSTKLNVVIDLGGNFLWFNSVDYFNAASSYRPILCGSRKCQIADTDGCILCISDLPVPGCTNNTCSDFALNPFTGTLGFSGLGEDALHVRSARGAHVQYTVDDFPFQYSDPVLRTGLVGLAAGAVGIGRTGISLQAQLASAFKIREKFALCVPPAGGDGNLIVGETAYSIPFEEISKSSLFTTPLVKNPVSISGNEVIGNLTHEYFINVKSIKVGSKTVLSLNKTLLSINKKDGSGGTSIRTVRPYTTLHKSIYKALIKAFVRAAASKNIKRVKSVAPLGACFVLKTVTSSKTGPQVPTIDLVMNKKKGVFWRFYGSNSMVRVSKDVTCLAFVEGGINVSGPTTSIEVGGYQMENHLLEFDVASSKLGFSSSLLLHNTTCSKFGSS